MAKKKNKPTTEETKEKAQVNYYEINKDAVDRLVNASSETAPEVSDAEIEKISGKKRFNIPNGIKVFFIKWWFNGAICFFFYLGLGTVLSNYIDQLFILGAATGVCTDLLTNHMLRFIERTERQNDKYQMITMRKYWSLLLNIPYAYLIVFCVFYLYGLINLAAQSINPDITVPVGPILFGILYLLVDTVFISMKHLMIKIVEDAKAKQ